MKGPFFYRQADQSAVGPLSVQELKQHAASGQLNPDERVWTDDAPRGCTARKINGLFSPNSAEPRGAAAPPPLPFPEISSAPAGVMPPTNVAAVARATSSTVLPSTMPPLRVTPAAPAAGPFASRALVILKRAGVEVVLTAQACLAQIGRAIEFVRVWLSVGRVRRESLTALESLGSKLATGGLGDAGLRAQLSELHGRRQAVATDQSAARLLATEERGLHVRLATAALDAPTVPSGWEPAIAEARRIHSLSVAAQERRRAQRLFPAESSVRLRVAVGFAIAILAIWLGTRPGERGGKAAAGQAETAGIWLEEDNNWPRRRIVGQFEGEMPHGECKLLDADDRLLAVANYDHGVLEGQSTMYFPSGARFSEHTFVAGKISGTRYIWFEDGTLADSMEWEDDLGHGEHTMYYANGNIFARGQNVRGKTEGKMDCYLPDGRHCSVLTYADGEQVGTEDLIAGSDEDRRLVDERAKYSLVLKDHWSRASRGELK